MKLPQSLVARYLAVAGSNVVNAGLGFVVVLALTRWLGVEGFGEVTLALSLVTYGLVFASFGTDLSAVARVANRPQTVRETIGATLLLRLTSGALTYGALLAVVSLVPGLVAVRPLFVIVGLSLLIAGFDFAWLAQGLHRTHAYALAATADQALYAVLAIAVLIAGGGPRSVVVAKLAATALVAVGWIRWTTRRFAWPAFSGAALIELVRRSAPLAGTQLLRATTLGSDAIILGALASLTQVGLYSVGFRVFLLLATLGNSYFVILLPRFAERATSPGAIRSELRGALRNVVGGSLAVAASAALTAGFLLPSLFGSEFAAGVPAFRILMVALPASLVGRLYRQALIALDGQARDLRATVATTIVSVGLKLVLVSRYGATGAAIGLLAGELLMVPLQRLAVDAALRERSRS